MRHFLSMIVAASALMLWTGCRDQEEPEIPAIPAPAPPVVPPELEDEPPHAPQEFGLRYESISQAELAAIEAAEAWLKIVDSGRYDDSWEEAAAYFQRAVPKENWQSSLGTVRTPLGRAVERRLRSRQYRGELPGAPDGQYVVIEYESSFQNKAAAVETVTPMRDADGRWRVSGYYIR